MTKALPLLPLCICCHFGSRYEDVPAAAVAKASSLTKGLLPPPPVGPQPQARCRRYRHAWHAPRFGATLGGQRNGAYATTCKPTPPPSSGRPNALARVYQDRLPSMVNRHAVMRRNRLEWPKEEAFDPSQKLQRSTCQYCYLGWSDPRL